MSAASTTTSLTAPDVNNSRAAYKACIPEAHDELNTGKQSFSQTVPASRSRVLNASSQCSPALPLHDATSNGGFPEQSRSANARCTSACHRATPESEESIPCAG